MAGNNLATCRRRLSSVFILVGLLARRWFGHGVLKTAPARLIFPLPLAAACGIRCNGCLLINLPGLRGNRFRLRRASATVSLPYRFASGFSHIVPIAASLPLPMPLGLDAFE